MNSREPDPVAVLKSGMMTGHWRSKAGGMALATASIRQGVVESADRASPPMASDDLPDRPPVTDLAGHQAYSSPRIRSGTGRLTGSDLRAAPIEVIIIGNDLNIVDISEFDFDVMEIDIDVVEVDIVDVVAEIVDIVVV